MKILDISFKEMVGNSMEFRSQEELRELIVEFAKYLKVKKYSCYISDLTIHINTAKYSYDISEKRTNKFTIVKEDNYNNRKISYVQVMA